MSAFSETGEYAVVSLGCSCQTAEQINVNLAALDEGSLKMGRNGSYYDFLITPIDTVIRFVESGIPEFTQPDELIWNYGPYWIEQQLWFAHYFRRKNQPFDAKGDHQDSLAKVEYLRAKFSKLDGYQRLRFVISNTQNSLIKYCRGATFDDLFSFSGNKISRLDAALRQRFQHRYEGLLVVENERTKVDRAQIEGVKTALQPMDSTRWRGNDDSWRATLQAWPSTSAVP